MPTVRGNTAATATNSPTSPSSTAVGDLVIVFHWTKVDGNGVPTHSIQSNFVEVATQAHDDGSTDGRLSVAYKIATSAGANTYNAYTSSAGTDFAGIIVLTVGTWENTLVGDVKAGTTGTTNAAPNPTAITTPQTQCLVMVVSAWHLTSAASGTVTQPSGYTAQSEISGSAAAELAVATKVVATATSEDPAAWADSVTPNGTSSLTIAFRPRDVNLTAAQATFTETGNAATLTRQLKLAAETVAFTETGNVATLSKGRTMAATAGAFTLTGNDATLTYTPGSGDPVITAEAGTFVETGSSAGLFVGHVLSASSGSFTETGNAAGLLVGHRLAAATGTFSETGNLVGLAKGRTMAAATRALTLTGNAAGLTQQRRLVASTGVFAETGQSTGLLFGHRLTASSGAFVEAGQPVSFLRGKGMQAGIGAFALTGNAADLRAARLLGAVPGSFALSGLAATLVLGTDVATGPPPHVTLTIHPTAYVVLATEVISLMATLSLSVPSVTLTLEGDMYVGQTIQVTLTFDQEVSVSGVEYLAPNGVQDYAVGVQVSPRVYTATIYIDPAKHVANKRWWIKGEGETPNGVAIAETSFVPKVPKIG